MLKAGLIQGHLSRISSIFCRTFATNLSPAFISPAKRRDKNLSYVTFRPHIPRLVELIGYDLDFDLTEDEAVIVFTDGSCLNNNYQSEATTRKGGIGVYWGKSNHPLNVSLPYGGSKLTSNRAEIAAVHVAILLAKAFQIERLCIRTDSKYVASCCKLWLPLWRMNNWKLKSDKPVSNQDLWRRMADDLVHVLVDFEYRSDETEGIKMAHDLAQSGANASLRVRPTRR